MTEHYSEMAGTGWYVTI